MTSMKSSAAQNRYFRLRLTPQNRLASVVIRYRMVSPRPTLDSWLRSWFQGSGSLLNSLKSTQRNRTPSATEPDGPPVVAERDARPDAGAPVELAGP